MIDLMQGSEPYEIALRYSHESDGKALTNAGRAAAQPAADDR